VPLERGDVLGVEAGAGLADDLEPLVTDPAGKKAHVRSLVLLAGASAALPLDNVRSSSLREVP
jgi:hypothetical protein